MSILSLNLNSKISVTPAFKTVKYQKWNQVISIERAKYFFTIILVNTMLTAADLVRQVTPLYIYKKGRFPVTNYGYHVTGWLKR